MLSNILKERLLVYQLYNVLNFTEREGKSLFTRIAIVGLGLIGGSMGLALHKANAATEITGYDLGRGVSTHAQKIGAIDQAYDALADAVRGAELVILATPVGAMRSLLQDIAPYISPDTVVTDVASTKTQVIHWADELLGTKQFVGGHPMTGKEVSGVEAADATLFHNHVYCITPTEHTPESALQKVITLAEIVGARVRFLSPEQHDEQVAGVSHLPFLASIALVNTASAHENWGSTSRLAASGFRDMSRLAAGNPEMYRDICLTNASAIGKWLEAYIAELEQLKSRILEQDKDLNETFAHAQQVRLEWLAAQDLYE
ncbi:MAG TPA: prephenate dehydrogenase/arogenate dehydrogenase family protein [Ktedonobacter sp.]|nr:prephenate dehydrogenase/arogenate dehydrogenase family protein [Ktedonobacter sp.]